MRGFRDVGRFVGVAALALAGWSGTAGAVAAEPASGLGVRLFVHCQEDVEVARYFRDALRRELAKVDHVVLVEEGELAGLYVYGN